MLPPDATTVRYISLTGTKKTLWDYDMGTDSYGIAISENGRVIAAGCDDQGVYYLNSRQGESWSYGTGKCVKGIALTPDGRFVAAGSFDRCVYLSTGEGEHLWKYPTGDAVVSTALTNEAREVFAASGRSVLVLDRSGAEIQTITPQRPCGVDRGNPRRFVPCDRGR